MPTTSLQRVTARTVLGALAIAAAVLSPAAAQAQADPAHGTQRTSTSSTMVRSNTSHASRGTVRPALTGPGAIDSRLRSIGVDPARAVVERGRRNYAGPHCPGPGWTCTSTSRPVVQIARDGTANRADCAAGIACVVLQVATGRARNVAVCVRLLGTTQACSVAQSNASGSNAVTAIELALGAGANQSASQSISITQSNGTGENTASVLQGVTLIADTKSSHPISQALDVHQSIDVVQDATSGANVVEGVGRAALTQSQALDARAASSSGITQAENEQAAGTNMSIDLQQNQGTPAATGTNTSAFRQTSTLTTTAVSPGGPVTQTQSSTVGGLTASVNQFSAGLSKSSAAQSETQIEVASTTPGGSTLPPSTTQTQTGRCGVAPSRARTPVTRSGSRSPPPSARGPRC